MYITVSIGNSDNKLTQKLWSHFCDEVNIVVTAYGKVHFFGGPPINMPWQNAAWIVEIKRKDFEKITRDLTEVRKKYGQESLFLLCNEALFI